LTIRTGQRRPTLGNVATLAEVSIATASKVVNAHSDVAAATRERVESAISQLGYTGPRTRRGTGEGAVEFMIDKLTSSYAMEVLRGVTLAAEEQSIDIVVSRVRHRTSTGASESNAAWTQRIIAVRRIGAILVTASIGPSTHQNIAQARLPVVVIDPLELSNPEIVSVSSTNWLGGRTAAEHVIQLGHTRLAMIGGPVESIGVAARVDGFRSACQQAGITIAPRFVRQELLDHDGARRVAQEWFSLTTPPTAIVASSDEQAMGVLDAARQAGLRVPQDVSVVGYDDTYLAAWANPPLTSVRQPLQEIGRVALRTVLQLSNMETLDSNHIELATSLVVRDSTAPPRSLIERRTRA